MDLDKCNKTAHAIFEANDLQRSVYEPVKADDCPAGVKRRNDTYSVFRTEQAAEARAQGRPVKDLYFDRDCKKTLREKVECSD